MDKVMEFTGCSEEQARLALENCGNDIFEAVLSLTPGSKIALPKKIALSEDQIFFKTIREQMSELTDSISKGFSFSNQSGPSEHSETQNLHEERAQQKSYPDTCHPPSPESVVQIPEIACQLLSECSFDSQSNVRTLPCSAQECRQSCPCLETES